MRSRRCRINVKTMTFVCAAVATLVAGVALAIPVGRQAQRAATPAETYTETLPGTRVTFEMVAIPGGTFQMGSPDGEPGREPDEGPQVKVQVAPFWIGKHEVTWDEYDAFAFARGASGARAVDTAAGADAVTRPSRPYGDESRGFGRGRQPVLGITHHAAMEYCRWLSQQTGKTYRLPTEAEWEYAARAGEPGATSARLNEAAWLADNAEGHPHPVGQKAPNAWGLHDMLGNVSEWVLDQYQADRYKALSSPGQPVARPVVVPDERRYAHTVRGGSYQDRQGQLRYADRAASTPAWSAGDPQQPKSIWWHTDQTWVGFRVARAVDEQPELRGLLSKVTRGSK
jgi:formylglycine-generating enzyme required for sulfatase activity